MSIKSMLAASAIAMFTATSNAHMIMASPFPYGKPSTSPLAADGSDFPCKATTTGGAPVTNMAIGSQQTLSFNGTAVHAGGSCQVSLTTDNPATKSSKWMVIHSIMGGCPARGEAGNMPDPPGGIEPPLFPNKNTYKYTIPKGIKEGSYTLAWTWHNKLGNREMYMNCASVKVTGGSSKRDTSLNETEYAIPELSARDTPSFPSLFIANIPETDCTTPSGKDVQYPDPGSSVEKAGVASDLSAPTGPKCGKAGTQAAPAGGDSSTGASSAGGATSSPAVPEQKAVASPDAAAAPAAPQASSGSALPAAAPPVASGGLSPFKNSTSSEGAAGAASPSSAPASAPASDAPGSAGSSSGSGASAGGMICSPDGKQFAVGGAAGSPVFQPVAAGTSCKGGQIGFARVKRSAKYAVNYRA